MKPVKAIIVLGIVLGLLYSEAWFEPRDLKFGESQILVPDVEWIAINVNADPDQQADAHLLRFRGGRDFLIDVGRSGKFLVPALLRHGVKRIEAALITHPHKDHYGGLPDLLASGIIVDRVYRNLPAQKTCDQEIPWGCDFNDVNHVFDSVRSRGIDVKPLFAGNRLFNQGDTTLDVLAAFTHSSPHFQPPSINDMSVLMRLSSGLNSETKRFLFTGDLDRAAGDEILALNIDVQADILKAPHHGCGGFVGDNFLDRVRPAVIIVPAPKRLWESKICNRLKDYAKSHRIPVLVNAIDGEIRVAIESGKITLATNGFERLTNPHSELGWANSRAIRPLTAHISH